MTLTRQEKSASATVTIKCVICGHRVVLATHHMVVYGKQRHDGTTESYWSVYAGDEANARIQFDNWNNLPTTDALYPFMKTRGWHVLNVLPCDERGNDPKPNGAAILNCGGVGRKLVPPAGPCEAGVQS